MIGEVLKMLVSYVRTVMKYVVYTDLNVTKQFWTDPVPVSH